MSDERRDRGAVVAEEAVDPKAAQAATTYRCVCGAKRKGDWPDCCATAEAFNAPEHRAKLAGHAAPEVAAPASAPIRPRVL